MVHNGEDAVAAFLHVGVGADASEQRRQAESGPGLTASLPARENVALRHKKDFAEADLVKE